MTLITSEGPICTGVSPPVNQQTHTHTHAALIFSDSAHIQLGPTVLVHVTDHKQNIHSSAAATPQDTGRGYPRNTKRQGCGECVCCRNVCCARMRVCVCVCGASREGEQMPSGHIISLTSGQSQQPPHQQKQREFVGMESGWGQQEVTTSYHPNICFLFTPINKLEPIQTYQVSDAFQSNHVIQFKSSSE